MKKKFLTFLFAICFMLPCAIILTACGGKDPEKTLSSISVEAVDSDAILSIVYEPNVSERFDLNDFTVTANYSDGSTEEVTEGVTMTTSGTFDCLTNDGKYIFTYQEKTAEVQVYIHQRNIETNEFFVWDLEESYRLENPDQQITPEIRFEWSEKDITLVKDVDYTVSYGENNGNTIGETGGSVTITGQGNYDGTITRNFAIWGVSSTAEVEFPNSEITYDGNNHIHNELMSYDYIQELEGVDYVTYSYSTDNGFTWHDEEFYGYDFQMVNAGTYKIRAHFVMDTGYEGLPSATKTVTINPMNLNDAYFYGPYAQATFANKEITFGDLEGLYFQIKQNGDDLVFGTDFVVDTDYNEDGFINGYKDNIYVTTNAGVVIKGQGNFTGSKTITFAINPLELWSGQTEFSNLQEQWTFNGCEIEPTFDLSYEGVALVEDSDYTVYYDYNVFAGTGRINIIYQGNYTGREVKTFVIKPYVLDISCLSFEDEPLTYNTKAQGIEISQESLGTLIGGMNSNIIKLFHNPADETTIRYAITYRYTDGDELAEIPIDAGDYKAYASFGVVNDTANEYWYFNSIQLMNGSIPVETPYDVISKSFTIAPFEINSTNTIHQFENVDYRTNSSVTYKGDYFDDISTQLVIDFGSGTTATFEVNQWGVCNVGEYILEPDFDSEDTNYTFSKDTCGLENLTFTINKLELTAGNFETYAEIPTITCIEGDGANKYKISAFTSKLEGTYASENAELFIVDYNAKENKFAVKLIAENYNMTETLWITPVVANVIDLGIFSSIKMGTTGSSDTTDVTDTFFTENLLAAGKYFEFYFTEEVLNDESIYGCYRKDKNTTNEAIKEGNTVIGHRVHLNGADSAIGFEIYENGYYNTIIILTKTYYVTPPAKLISDDNYLKNIYVLAYNKSTQATYDNRHFDYYSLYEVVSGEKYDVDYVIDDFEYGITNVINIIVDATENTVSYLCSKSLEEMGIALGSLDTNDKNTLKNNTIDIANFKQDVVYLIYYSQTTDLGSQKSMLFDFTTDDGIETIYDNDQIKNYKDNINGVFIYVDKDYEGIHCIPTESNMQVWDKTNEQYVDGDIYISPKGKLVISATELTEIDTATDVESGINVFVLPVRYVYTFAGHTYYVESKLTIYRESFIYKYYGEDNYNNGFKHNNTLYDLTYQYYGFALTINSYTNDGSDLAENDYGILSLTVMKNETELATLAEIQALDLTEAFSLDYTEDGITYNSASLETYEIDGETRLYLVINYDLIVTDGAETPQTILERTGCERLIQLNYAA
ncbi:MAG: hypothetical protein IKB42_00540 [Clostridia bacterium]|nr:hypothetical protein [Clostridia bacterium]